MRNILKILDTQKSFTKIKVKIISAKTMILPLKLKKSSKWFSEQKLINNPFKTTQLSMKIKLSTLKRMIWTSKPKSTKIKNSSKCISRKINKKYSLIRLFLNSLTRKIIPKLSPKSLNLEKYRVLIKKRWNSITTRLRIGFFKEKSSRLESYPKNQRSKGKNSLFQEINQRK